MSVLRRSPTKPVLRGYLNEPAVFVRGVHWWLPGSLKGKLSRKSIQQKMKEFEKLWFQYQLSSLLLTCEDKTSVLRRIEGIGNLYETNHSNAACWRPSPCKRSAKTAVYVIANLILPVQRQCFPKTSRLWFSEVR